ncbi:MAG: hypothetical protein AB8B55_06080 [Mariniblastus sp.]
MKFADPNIPPNQTDPKLAAKRQEAQEFYAGAIMGFMCLFMVGWLIKIVF